MAMTFPSFTFRTGRETHSMLILDAVGIALLFMTQVCTSNYSAQHMSPGEDPFTAVFQYHSASELMFNNVDCNTAFERTFTEAGSKPRARLGLVHVQGKCSPLRSPSPKKRSDFVLEILDGDAHRLQYLISKKTDDHYPQAMADQTAAPSVVISAYNIGSLNYVTKVGLGTPPRDLLLVLDTGSNLAWTQCFPCASNGTCYSQIDPMFDPSNSSSYQSLPCNSSQCQQLEASTYYAGRCSSKGECLYEIHYGGTSFSKGELATDTLIIADASVKELTIGCGRDNNGSFGKTDGFLGLGQGPLAFPTQTLPVFGGEFAYCLPRPGSKGFIDFGIGTVQSSTSTPLIKNTAIPSIYFVWVEAITLQGKMLPVHLYNPPPQNTLTGSTLVDSGTVITHVAASQYATIRDAFVAATSSLPRAPPFSILDTCYNLSSSSSVTIPLLSFQLHNNLSFTIPASNTLIRVDDAGTFCFAFAESADEYTIIGNYQQQGFRFGYDVPKALLSIDPQGGC